MSRHRDGQPVKITGNVSCTETGQGMRGMRGTVLGENCEGRDSAGNRVVNVRLEDGTVASVPQSAIERG